MPTLPVPIGGGITPRFEGGKNPPTNESEKSYGAAHYVAPPAVLDRAADYARSEKAEATRRAYRSDFAHFSAWCDRFGAASLPASIETCVVYLAELADSGLKASTISRRVAAITYAHRLAGHASPPTAAEPVKAVLRGIRRRIGVAVSRKSPATGRALASMLKRIPDTLAGKRDRALLLIGFAAALRRSELVNLNVSDVERVPEGIVLHIRKSKTDQEGAGAAIAVPRGTRLKPVEALEAWLAICKPGPDYSDSMQDRPISQNSDIPGEVWLSEAENNKIRKLGQGVNGPVFVSIGKGGRVNRNRLSDKSVAGIVKRWAAAAKLDPAMFSGHSLRAGFVTTALERDAAVFKIMDVTRHKRVETLRIYDRRAKAFKQHAGKDFL